MSSRITHSNFVTTCVASAVVFTPKEHTEHTVELVEAVFDRPAPESLSSIEDYSSTEV